MPPKLRSRLYTALAECTDRHRLPLTHPQVDLLARVAADTALRLELETDHVHTDGTLTPSELIVLRLVAAGVTDAEIAKRAGRSTTAIHAVVQRIVRTLGAVNRTNAVGVACHRGLVSAGQVGVRAASRTAA